MKSNFLGLGIRVWELITQEKNDLTQQILFRRC